jgi:hypothetical protein
VNLLVAGGLLILGVLFLVALVFVLRSEPNAKESISVPPPIPAEPEEAKTQSAATEPSSTVETQLTPDEGTAPVDAAHTAPVAMREQHPLANGQFYEMVNELRSMHRQTQELEQRLSTLIDMAQRVEQTQNGCFPIEEQDLSDNQAAH